MKYSAKLLGELANVYTILEETESLVRLRVKGVVTLTELQLLHDKGFRLCEVHRSDYSTTLLMEKPNE